MSNQDFYRGALTRKSELKQADKTAKASVKKEAAQGSEKGNGKKSEKTANNKGSYDSGKFKAMLGQKVMLIMEGGKLFFKDEHFEPVFSGKLVEAANGYITLSDAKIKRGDNTVYKFPSPVSFSVEKILRFLPLEKKSSGRRVKR